MTVRTALLQGQKLLEDAGIGAPRLTAEVLLLHAIRLEIPCDRAWLYAHSTDELHELWWIHYGRYLHQRMQGKPTQYITGVQEFYGREFRVTPDVLIPRPETEHLIETALARAHAAETIVDIGTGSGALAVTLALETGRRVVATDLSPAALQVAQDNARRWHAPVDFLACDLGHSLTPHRFDLAVSNPPYIPLSQQATLQREVRDWEPPLALYGGDDGLSVYRRLIPEAARLLRSGGWLMMEAGLETAEAVGRLLNDWDSVEIINDLAAIPRVVIGRTRFQ
jgi:release factor glutamine methyltransferase